MWIYLYRGVLERCVECSDKGIYLAAELGVPVVLYPSAKALALIKLGRYDAAWASLQEEIVDNEHRMGNAMQHFGTGVYFLEIMAYEKASEAFEYVIEQARLLKRPWLRSWAYNKSAETLIRTGQLDQLKLDKIVQELPLGIPACIDFRYGPQLGIRTENEIYTGAGPLKFACNTITPLEDIFIFCDANRYPHLPIILFGVIKQV